MCNLVAREATIVRKHDTGHGTHHQSWMASVLGKMCAFDCTYLYRLTVKCLDLTKLQFRNYLRETESSLE